jgi:hypothetical protein
MTKEEFKIKEKIGWAWWCLHIVPASWEADIGESLEPSLGNIGRPFLQINEINEKMERRQQQAEKKLYVNFLPKCEI